jgi:hypothetical protein
MSLREIMDKEARLVILRSLLDCRGEANESILQSCLDVYGINVSRDEVRTQMSWLNEQGMIELEIVGSCFVATLKSRGQDVAEGRSTVPGIKKPRIGE